MYSRTTTRRTLSSGKHFYVVEMNINGVFYSMEEKGCVQWPVASRRIEGKDFVFVMVEESDVWYKIVIEQREKNNIV